MSTDWFYQAFIDPTSPIFHLQKDVVINILFLLLSVGAIAPLSAQFVLWRQNRHWANARRHFVSSVRTKIFKLAESQGEMYKWSRAQAYLEPNYRLSAVEMFLDSAIPKLSSSLENIRREIEYANMMLSPRSHSLVSEIRVELDSFESSLALTKEQILWRLKQDRKKHRAAYARVRHMKRLIFRVAIPHERRFEQIIQHYKKQRRVPILDMNIVLGNLWTITQIERLHPRCTEREFASPITQVFFDSPTYVSGSQFLLESERLSSPAAERNRLTVSFLANVAKYKIELEGFAGGKFRSDEWNLWNDPKTYAKSKRDHKWRIVD